MKYFWILLLVLVSNFLYAQDEEVIERSKFNVGFGGGIDYGGFGGRGTVMPTQAIGLFVGLGYNLNSLGYNAGAQWLIPAKNNYLYLTGMYGYNAVIIVKGEINDKATYYGFSGGIGYQLNRGKGRNFWNFELLLPVRNSNFQHDMDALEVLGADLREPLPVAFSIGYHIRM